MNEDQETQEGQEGQEGHAEGHLVSVLVHVAEAKRILLILAGLMAVGITVVSIAVYSDPDSAFRAGQELGFWDLMLSATQRMAFWILSAAVLLVAWAMLTVGELYVAIQAVSDDPTEEVTEQAADLATEPETGLATEPGQESA